MLSRKEVVEFLDNLLKPNQYVDSTLNGLQVEGKEVIENIYFSVDSSLSTFELASDFLIVHHGLIWNGIKNINNFYKKRFSILFNKDINLYVSHMPLDFNEEIGNNISLIKQLNFKSIGVDFTYNFIENLGVIVNFYNIFSLSKLFELVKEKINPLSRIYNFNTKDIDHLFVCSGAISRGMLEKLAEIGICNILTGEASSESTFFYILKEYEMNLILAGHYHTEVFGLLALKEMMEKEFKNHVYLNFIDLPH